MKYTIMILLLMIFCKGYGQNNQIKLYIQQIAANKVYLEYLQKGYSIVRNGLNTIGNIKNGHFSLDIDFFDGLESVNPKVRHYAKVADIGSLSVQIIKRAQKLMTQTRNSEFFTEREIAYVARVTDALLSGCAEMLDELALLLKKSEFTMSDDERIKRVDMLHAQMRDQYAFVNYFSGELQLLQLQKNKEQRDAGVLKDLVGH